MGERGAVRGGREVSVLTPTHFSTLYSLAHSIPQKLLLVKALIAERWTLYRPYRTVLWAEFDMVNLCEIVFPPCILRAPPPSPSPFFFTFLGSSLFTDLSETKNRKHCSNCAIQYAHFTDAETGVNNFPEVRTLITGCVTPKPLHLNITPFCPESCCSPGFWTWAWASSTAHCP